MEKVGFVRLLDRLIGKDLKIAKVSTDRHNQIRKLMKVDPKYKDIVHTIDPWHVLKGMKKKLNAKAKKKGCDDIGTNLNSRTSNPFLEELSCTYCGNT